MNATCKVIDCTTCTNIHNARLNAHIDSMNASDWYASVARNIQTLANRINVDESIVAGFYAAFSINTPWDRNVMLVERFVECIANDAIDTMHGTLGMSINIARNVYAMHEVNGVLDYTSLVKDKNNFKIRSFTCNVQNDCKHDIHCVTVDRWAQRIASNFIDCNSKCKRGKHNCGYVPTGNEYHAIAACYRKVAIEFNEAPHITQAITWVDAINHRYANGEVK